MKHFVRAFFGFVLIGSFAALGCKKPTPARPPSSSPVQVVARNSWIVGNLDGVAGKLLPVKGAPNWKLLNFSHAGDECSVVAEPNLSSPDGSRLRLGFVFDEKNEGRLVTAEKWDVKASTWTTLSIK